ncbi:hypothetical protein NQ318_000515 [Aromia moschata]|uniref:MAGE domain-containing protein n=1 Tax=Aromia moschata TaxID=1265417 RepID=A0AAV8YFW0_9CUCU|nr:hypothetical protein NQ318_000515 [Aromia moschata]
MIAIDSGKKEYIISNILLYVQDPLETLNKREYPKDSQKIILLLVLSHIFMSNNCIGEVSLQSFLTSLGIDIERRHQVMGNIKEYINHTLKNRKYLNIDVDPVNRKMSYSWGPRAEKEISKQEILNFVCKMYKDRLPNSWVNQYKMAQEQVCGNQRETEG